MSAVSHYLRGLVEEALRPTDAAVPLERLRPRPQPRRRFDEAALADLARSIKAEGVLQPLLVRRQGEGYEIIAGERRWRAARMAGLSTVPVIILEADEAAAGRLALVENLQREDLNPYEETLGILSFLEMRLSASRKEVISLLHRMRNEARGRVTRDVTGSPQAQQAQQVEEAFAALGRMEWQSFVRNRLPLLRLPQDLQEALTAGSIPYSAALELRRVEDPTRRQALLERVAAGLSLQELRREVKASVRASGAPGPKPAPAYAPALRRLAARLEALPPERQEGARRLLQAAQEALTELERLLEGADPPPADPPRGGTAPA